MTIGITSAVVYLKFSNAQFINFTNMLLKNDSNTPLSPEVSWENIEKRANYLKKKNFNLFSGSQIFRKTFLYIAPIIIFSYRRRKNFCKSFF